MSSRLPPSPSGHPVLRHALRFTSDPFAFTESATTECGDIYRLDIPAIDDIFVLAHPDYLRQVLVTDIDSFGKTDDFRRAFGTGLLSAEGETWRRQRELLQPLFFREQITGYAEDMVECIERRLETWEEGTTLDVETEMRDLTLEILFATLFGRKLVPGHDNDLRDAADGLNDWFAPTSWILPDWIPTPARRHFDQSTTRLREEVRTLLDEDVSSSADGEETLDLLSQLQHARDADNGAQLTAREIEDQLITMVFAGHETTATALAFAWYLLSTHPDIRQQFHDELDTVLDGDSPSLSDIPELDVTERILKETLRLYPPIHTIPRQTTTDTTIGGYQLPEGHEVQLSIIAIHRDEQIYDEPLSFRPDRWTDGFESELREFAYAPFGGGRRSCIGREFALLEAKLVLATIGQQFDLEREREEDLNLEPRVTIRTADGIPMRVQGRS